MLRNDRQGFTLIELLIVVVIIGILAAIALPKFGETRERAYLSSMQSDLRNLQTSQEMYYTDNYTYKVASVDNLDGNGGAAATDDDLGFTASSGVKVDVVAPAAGTIADGYAATATHKAMAGFSCILNVGGTGTQGIVCDDITT